MALATLACSIPACGKDTNESPDAAATDGGGLGQFPDPTKCVTLPACQASECPPVSADGGFGCTWECGQPSLCGLVHFTQTGSSYSVDATNTRCVLTAMRDATLGEVAWGSTLGAATYQEDTNIIASRQTYGWWQYNAGSGGGYNFQRFAGRPLQTPAFFQTCLDSNDPAAWLKCLQTAYSGCN